MAETKQLSIDLREAAETLAKGAGLTEGKWTLGVEFGLAIGNFAQNKTVAPSAIIQITKLMLTRHEPGAPELPYTVDASQFVTNPPDPKSKRK